MIAIDLVNRINQTLLEKIQAGGGLGIPISGRGALCWPCAQREAIAKSVEGKGGRVQRF